MAWPAPRGPTRPEAPCGAVAAAPRRQALPTVPPRPRPGRDRIHDRL